MADQDPPPVHPKVEKRQAQAKELVGDIRSWQEWIATSIARFTQDLTALERHERLPDETRKSLAQLREEFSKLQKATVSFERAVHRAQQIR
jgi:hypothetical protein